MQDAPNKAHAAGAGGSEWNAPKRSSKMHVYREVAEWLKAHAWKVCIPKGIEGSNPFLSAISKATSFLVAFFMAEINMDLNPGSKKKARKPFLTRVLLPRLKGSSQGCDILL